ncbi:unnamed protein product [Paramecium pentaurelia]|uniref:Uncharacterized protein n=1 Tax=Paramecium pentaurelia TaxID=43138 RepID=A0A8S1RV16_9CILI|nr:unnamed protein product [Paramecium pentaurelia]
MENASNFIRMNRDLRFNGLQQTVKGNIKVKDVKFLLAQKADTFPQLLVAFTKFGILEDETELFKIYDNIYVYSIGYLIEKLKNDVYNKKSNPNNNSIQLSTIIRSFKDRKSFNEIDHTFDQRQYNSVDTNYCQKKYKNGIDYVQEQIKKSMQKDQNQTKECNNNSNTHYYCQIQKTEESIKPYEEIRNSKSSISHQQQQGSRIYYNLNSPAKELQKQIQKYQDIIEQKEYQIKQLEQINQSSTLKMQIQCQQIENQDKYIIRLKQQELKYVKLLGTISEYLQKIIGQIQQKLERKQKQQLEKEKSSTDFLTRQIQSARADYKIKIKQQQLFISNSKLDQIFSAKLIDLQNQLTETILLNQSIDDLVQAAEFLELDSSFRFDFE